MHHFRNSSMGNTLLESSTASSSDDNDTSPPSLDKSLDLTFHEVCGSNIQFNSTKTHAKRVDGFCKAIVFSHKRLRPYEVLSLKIKQVCNRWNGYLRLGFTSESLNALHLDIKRARYVCPDLTNKQGFWARGIQETLSLNDIVSFYFDSIGNVYYSINYTAQKHLFGNINLTKTKLLYALIDIYGNVTEIELLKNGLSDTSSFKNDNNHSVSLMTSNFRQEVRPIDELYHLYDNDFNESINILSKPSTKLASIEYPKQKLIHHSSNESTLFKFNTFLKGKYVDISVKSQIAYRLSHDLCQTHGYAFLDGSLNKNESICFQLISIDKSFKHADISSLSFGVTNCKLDNMHSDKLPLDSYDLLDRKEYWIVYKNLLNDFKLYDEVCLCLQSNGSISLKVNGQLKNECLFSVDTSLKLTYFFDICGQTSAIKLISSCGQQTCTPHKHQDSNHKPKEKQIEENVKDECVICLASKTNCVFYTCGHMCACYECAVALKNSSAPNLFAYCPICREIIRDVVRCFKS